MRSKLMLVGQGRAGKTALSLVFRLGRVVGRDLIPSTVGVDAQVCEIKGVKSGGHRASTVSSRWKPVGHPFSLISVSLGSRVGKDFRLVPN